MSQKIVIYGDLIQDINLLEQPLPPAFHFQTLPHTVQKTTDGGVAYMKKLLEGTLTGCTITAPQVDQGQWEKNAVRVFQTWKQFPASAKSRNKVWRISKLMGRSSCTEIPKVIKSIKKAPQADLMLIDSMGMGFLGKELMWEDPKATHLKESEKWEPFESLVRKVNPKDIIFKLSSFREGLPLPCTSELLKKTTVILSVKALRERGADISEGLSWDKTIEDTVREFSNGLSSHDLALCKRVVVLFSTEGAAVFEPEKEPGKEEIKYLKKFIYHPCQYEGTFKTQHPGHFFGDISILTAAIIRHIMDPKGFPLFAALCLGLSAMRTVHEKGITEDKTGQFDINMPAKTACDLLSLPYTLKELENTKGATKKKEKERKEQIESIKKQLNDCLNKFACSFQHDLLHDGELKKQHEGESNLLRDTTGFGYEYVAAKASEIVIKGARKALNHVPIVSYGNFLTADRQEIERINSIRKLITTYCAAPGDNKPLSIAVFGPPGAGKSFAIKQLANELGFEKKLIHEFNLSQFCRDTMQELHTAFHQVRDASMKGKIPLIFWDEFDTDKYQWLKEFLAPMQDAEFRVGSVTHPFNKAIFIFAGGVTKTFQELDARKDDEYNKGQKVPDFISRLRGYVNIKGPNKPGSDDQEKESVNETDPNQVKEPVKETDSNHEYLIRRAILFRSILERFCSHLIGDDGTAAVSGPLVQAFLRVKKYKHGARSMESLITMSSLGGVSFFGESSLPSDDLMNLHVDVKNFRTHLQANTLEQPIIELIAAAYHEAWCQEKKDQGYELGEVRCDDETKKKTHPLLKAYTELSEKDKEANRITARLTQPKLNNVGLKLAWKCGVDKTDIDLNEYKETLSNIEHDIWLREHLLSGYEDADNTEDILRLHRNMRQFKELSDEDKKLDSVIIEALEEVLEDKQYTLGPAEKE